MVTSKETCILLFVKYPEKGKVKLRLSVDIDEEIVKNLYRSFVEDILIKIKNIDSQILICFSPVETKKKFQKWLGLAHLFLPQKGTNLGERMKNSFFDVFAKGFRRVVLIGSDSPDIPEKFIKRAFTILKKQDVVLGPTIDGGYYLIGFRINSFTPSIFEEISWGTERVFQETMTKITQTHRSVGLLPLWYDIDTINDLTRLILRSENTGFKSSQTMSYIRKNHLRFEDKNETDTRR